MPPPTTLGNTRIKRFSPSGASDSLDATDEFPGACSSLINLVPDPTTRNVWTCRPASVNIFNMQNCPNLTAGHTAGDPVVFKVVGNIVYGLFFDSTADEDCPFAYNLLTQAFITVSATGALNPSPSAYPPWTVAGSPPTIDLVGHFLIVTHPSFASPNFFGWFNLTTPTAPSWNTGDLTSGGAITFNGLGSIPAWVCQFNERAYFGVNGVTQPSVVATDVLALKVTNAGQVLTFGDNLPLTAAAPLGLSNQLGGIIQSLMVFKGSTNIYQITGDYALSNWTINTLNVATGTFFPRSICSTPLGLIFLSPGGMRIIDQNGTVSDPIGAYGKGISVPFIYQVHNTFAYAVSACDGETIRIAIATATGAIIEYWLNIPLKNWSGPHSTSCFIFGVYNGTFVTATDALGSISGLYFSDASPNSSSTFTEYGVALAFTMQSAQLEDNQQMAASEVAEYQVVGAVGSSTLTAAVSFVDSNGNVINTANVTFTTAGLQAYHVDFPAISVFNRIAIQITGNSAAGVRIGDSFLRLRTLSYLPPPPAP